MKMTKAAAEMFEKEIARAKSRGMTHFAKAVGCPAMKFGKTLEEAERKAIAADRAQFRAANPGSRYVPAAIQSGEVS